jgi:hypothetical protein
MIRALKQVIFAAMITTAGLLTTADRAEAQVYYAYAPETPYYDVSAPGGYWIPYLPPSAVPQTSFSYYTPAADPNAAVGGASVPNLIPVRAWDGGWTIGGYTSPAIPYYTSYRATRR